VIGSRVKFLYEDALMVSYSHSWILSFEEIQLPSIDSLGGSVECTTGLINRKRSQLDPAQERSESGETKESTIVYTCSACKETTTNDSVRKQILDDDILNKQFQEKMRSKIFQSDILKKSLVMAVPCLQCGEDISVKVRVEMEISRDKRGYLEKIIRASWEVF